LLFHMNMKQSATIESTTLSLDEPGSSTAGSPRRRDAVSASAIDRLYEALHAVRSIDERTPARDELWIVLWETVTTRSEAWVTPIGSNARVRVTKDDADAELIAAWEWLIANEDRARAAGPVELYRVLRGVATKSHQGSARSANADNMCGVTNVPGGTWVAIGRGIDLERVAS
jgi:putative transposon-encoded protein